MKSKLAVLAVLLAAQPAAATQLVELAPAEGDCAPGAAQCGRVEARVAAESDRDFGSGSIVAGLAGLLVLALVFGRRKPVLPQVVS
jgi:hypothetical protein